MMQPDFTDAVWRKCEACTDGTSCVEVARVDALIGIRDSKDAGNGPTLVFDEREWQTFIGAVRNGDFDWR